MNTSFIDKRPVYESMALALHEAIPGHHHQVLPPALLCAVVDDAGVAVVGP